MYIKFQSQKNTTKSGICLPRCQAVPEGNLKIKPFIFRTLSPSEQESQDDSPEVRFKSSTTPFVEIKVQKHFRNAAIKAGKALSSDGRGTAMYANTTMKGSGDSSPSEILVDLTRQDTLWSCQVLQPETSGMTESKMSPLSPPTCLLQYADREPAARPVRSTSRALSLQTWRQTEYFTLQIYVRANSDSS